MKLAKPINDWAKALYILNDCYLGGVSMAKVLTQYDATFYKFQNRLNEVLEEHPDFRVQKTMIPYVSKINGKTKHYMQYTPLSNRLHLRNLFNKINQVGANKKKK